MNYADTISTSTITQDQLCKSTSSALIVRVGEECEVKTYNAAMPLVQVFSFVGVEGGLSLFWLNAWSVKKKTEYFMSLHTRSKLELLSS